MERSSIFIFARSLGMGLVSFMQWQFVFVTRRALGVIPTLMPKWRN
jgi:hypothetical protein